MSRYYLKSMEIGFEVPIFDIEDTKSVPELCSSITGRYLASFDIIKNGLKLYQLPNLNTVLLFYLVVRVDSSTIDSERFSTTWNTMESNIALDIENYLKLNNLNYMKFD